MYLKKYCIGTFVSVIALSCALMGTSSSVSRTAYADEVTAQEESSEDPRTAPEPAPQPETQAPQPETPAPQPETQAPQPETPAPQPETQAPQTEAPAPQPEAQVSQTEAAANTSQTEAQANHSVAIPDNPKERRLNQTVVDAHELEGEEGFRVSVNGSEGVIFQPEDPFINVISAVSGGAYKADYVKPGTGYRKNFAEAAGNVQTAFNRIAALGSNIGMVFYSDDGTMIRFSVTAGGTFENKDAYITFTSDNSDKCTVSYNANGGSLSSESLVCTRKKGEMLSHFDVSASKGDLHFCGWYYGKSDHAKRVYPTDVIDKDVVIYAHFTDKDVLHVNYDLGFSTTGDGDLMITDVTVPETDGKYIVNNPPEIERDGYKIEKWIDMNDNEADFEDVRDGMTYRIIWEG